MQKNGLDLMADYVFYSRYSQKKENGELESWEDVNKRIYQTHRLKLDSLGLLTEDIDKKLRHAEYLENEKRFLSSQRGRQFAFPDWQAGILSHEARSYNCCATYMDRLDSFSEAMYLLLCGCGVGYSLHKEYISKLPIVKSKTGNKKDYEIADSIEGWADSIKELIYALYNGDEISFDYSLIRKKGSLINGKFKAPGFQPLKKTHQDIRRIFSDIENRQLRSIEIHDIMCYIAEAVISAGVRRASLISLFDKDDKEMLTAKTGDWWKENPQRAMANNSILSTYDDSFTYKELKGTMDVVRMFGEPASVNVPSYLYVVNPCGEILLKPIMDKKSCWAFCNLTEINAEKITTEKEFLEACEYASFVATIQSIYTNFKYLKKESSLLAEKDRNIGVSITGCLSNRLLDKDILLKGAKLVTQVNKETAELLGINQSRTCTTIKPAGSSSSILGTAYSGIHPAHADKYLRRIRIKKYSNEYANLKGTPLVRDLDGDNAIISFPISLDKDKGTFKDSLSAVEHLDYIKMVKHFWVNKGSEKKTVNHNVSATVEVCDDEWNEVAAILYTNKYLLTGVSLLPKAGDQIYQLAPFTRIYDGDIQDEYDKIVEYLSENEIDFNKIMSSKELNDVSDYSAIGCSGGACEIR